jgi:hypothetical protein
VIKAYIQKVLVDGIEQYIIDRDPGSKVSIEVLASEEMSAVSYGINGIVNRVDSPGVNYQFEVEVPKEPGEHTLSIEVVFKSGGKDQRTVTIRVRGKRKRSCTRYGVSRNDLIMSIRASDTSTAINLLKYLWDYRKFNFSLTISTERRADEEEIRLSARFRIRDSTSYNNVLRLLMALNNVTPSVEAVFGFSEPVIVDDDMMQKFKGWQLEFTVICEQ